MSTGARAPVGPRVEPPLIIYTVYGIMHYFAHLLNESKGAALFLR
jgi:hypothetical protein